MRKTHLTAVGSLAVAAALTLGAPVTAHATTIDDFTCDRKVPYYDPKTWEQVGVACITTETVTAPPVTVTATPAPVTETVTAPPVTETATVTATAVVTETVDPTNIAEVIRETITAPPVTEYATETAAPVTETATVPPVTETATEATTATQTAAPVTQTREALVYVSKDAQGRETRSTSVPEGLTTQGGPARAALPETGMNEQQTIGVVAAAFGLLGLGVVLVAIRMKNRSTRQH